MHDVVIAGASVAGAATAIHLARRGASVVVLDRARFPRPKVCGEGLFPSGVAALDDLGVRSKVEALSARVERLLFEFEGIECSGAVSVAGGHALGVRREVFDAALLEAAAAAGAEVACGCRVTGLLDGEGGFGGVSAGALRFEARAVVAADGLGSGLRSRAGLNAPPGRRRRYGVSAHLALDCPAGDAISVHFRPTHEVYITPVGEREVNVAVLLGAGEASRLGGRLEAAFRGYISTLPSLATAALLNSPRVAGPFPARAAAFSRANLLLAGDAAGFHDAISGEGMSLALRAARPAADAVLAYLESGSRDGFVAYERIARRMRRPSTLFADLMLALRDRPPLARRAMRNLARQPGTFARLIALNGSELEIRDLRPRDLAALVLGL
jgi:flavin-dependent dehydrogenase